MLGSGGRGGDRNGASLRGAVDVLAEPPPTALALAAMSFVWPYHDHPLVTLACAVHHGVGVGLRASGRSQVSCRESPSQTGTPATRHSEALVYHATWAEVQA